MACYHCECQNFDIAFGEFIYFIEEILSLKDEISDIKKPCSHTLILEELLFSIVSQSIDGSQLPLQLLWQHLIELSSTKEVHNLRSSQPVKCNLKEGRKKSTANQ
ncbi:hypothetical protein CR513_17492, partial [Mucuna pruriens]